MDKFVYIEDRNFYDILNNNIGLKQSGFIFTFINKFSEKEVIKTLIKEKKDRAIFINSDKKVNLVYRYKKSWKFLDTTIFDLYFAQKFDNYNLNSSNVNELKKDFLRDQNLSFDHHGRYNYKNIDENIVIIEQLLFLSEENWKNEIDKFSIKNKFLTVKKFTTKSDFYDFNIIEIERNNSLPGINRISVISKADNEITFTSGNTLTKVEKNNDKLDFTLISTSDSEVNSHYLNKGMFENLRNNFLQNKTSSAKISKRDILLSIIGLIVFLILSVFTFSFIFDPDNIESSFELMFSKTSLKQPWIYLLWFNFFISFFFSFIIMTIVFYISTGKKPNYKNMWTFFVAAQIKATTRFLTGEAIIGTIIWAWYLNRNSTIRTSVLAGTIASMSIIRIPLTFIIVSPFMIIGQVYSVEIFQNLSTLNNSDLTNINATFFYILSWGGFAWGLIHHSIIPIIILLPFAHNLFNYINTKVELHRNSNGIVDRLHNREMSIESMKNSVKTIFKRKDRIYRIALTLFLMTIIEALEIMYIFKIVENNMFSDYPSFDKANYNNFLQLSGVRMMVRNVYAFPIVNITPGNGMLIVEFFMKSTNSAIFISEHAKYNYDTSIMDYATDFSEQTAFITRFFNTYLKRFLSMLITLWVVKTIVTRKMKK